MDDNIPPVIANILLWSSFTTKNNREWTINWENELSPVLIFGENSYCNDSRIYSPSIIMFYRDIDVGRRQQFKITPMAVELYENTTAYFYDDWQFRCRWTIETREIHRRARARNVPMELTGPHGTDEESYENLGFTSRVSQLQQQHDELMLRMREPPQPIFRDSYRRK